MKTKKFKSTTSYKSVSKQQSERAHECACVCVCARASVYVYVCARCGKAFSTTHIRCHSLFLFRARALSLSLALSIAPTLARPRSLLAATLSRCKLIKRSAHTARIHNVYFI